MKLARTNPTWEETMRGVDQLCCCGLALWRTYFRWLSGLWHPLCALRQFEHTSRAARASSPAHCQSRFSVRQVRNLAMQLSLTLDLPQTTGNTSHLSRAISMREDIWVFLPCYARSQSGERGTGSKMSLQCSEACLGIMSGRHDRHEVTKSECSKEMRRMYREWSVSA